MGDPATSREPRRPPAPGEAIVELLVALAIIAAGLLGFIPYSSTPWLLAVATLFLWQWVSGWRPLGLRRPPQPARALALGVAVGVGYQLLGLYALEPLIARVTSAELPDVSAFRSLAGDGRRLAFWLALTWTLAAFAEEMVFRGWLMTRLAEIGRFSTAGWIAAALGSSALFGAIHLYQGASGMIATGLSGFVFACVYLAMGRNLWASIVAHGFMDTVGFVMVYLGVYPGL